MEEVGFYHPDRGYWQTLTMPDEATLADYPTGTTQIPLKPGPAYEWDGSSWIQQVIQPDRSSMTLTFAQLLIGLVSEGWITESEGTAWLGGALPAAVTGLIAQLPAAERFPATARAARPSVILRTDPLLEALAQSEGKTPEQVDEFFITYQSV